MKRIAITTLLCLMTLAVPAAAHDIDGTEVTFTGALPCAIACAYWVDNGFSPCEAPFPPGAYVDHVTSPAPSAAGKTTVLAGTLESEIDHDSFFCSAPAGGSELAQGSTPLNEPCDEILPHLPIPTGCHEDLSTPVRAGRQVIFRVYNWSDVPMATGEYGFLLI